MTDLEKLEELKKFSKAVLSGNRIIVGNCSGQVAGNETWRCSFLISGYRLSEIEQILLED